MTSLTRWGLGIGSAYYPHDHRAHLLYLGHTRIAHITGLPWHVDAVVKATHPDFQYQLIAEPEESGNGGRVRWVSGRPGEAPAYAGTDFIIARDGRIAAVYLFFDQLP